MAAQCATESLDNPLWQFSTAFYQRPEAEACLLELQQEGADVLLLLAALWLSERRQAWPEVDDFNVALQGYLGWRSEVVMPLRAVRNTLPKDDLPVFRNKVKALELEAEQYGLSGLYSLLQRYAYPCPDAESTEECTHENLNLALEVDGVRLNRKVRFALGSLYEFLEVTNETSETDSPEETNTPEEINNPEETNTPEEISSTSEANGMPETDSAPDTGLSINNDGAVNGDTDVIAPAADTAPQQAEQPQDADPTDSVAADKPAQ